MRSLLSRRSLLAAASGILLDGCGYVGDPLPPALYIPLPVADLSGVQQEETLVVRFTLPVRTTEDLPMQGSPEVDLRAAIWANAEWNEAEWEQKATRLVTLPPDNGVVSSRTSAEPWAGQRILLRVRVAGKSGRFSSWSEPVAIRILARPVSIRHFEVASAPGGVRLSWVIPANRPAGMLTEIFREQAGAKEFQRLVAVPGEHWDDPDALLGETYLYQIQDSLTQDDYNYVGPILGPLSITPVDTFAPAPPMAIDAVAGATAVELSWDRNQEPDFQEYRVYRSIGNGPFVQVGEPTASPVFSDTSAPFEEPLRYRVTAVDDKGNESTPSREVEITRP